ncbi:hypothetical protein TrLO_g1896 [Triparma laevis f. longispina]|uniref:Uncharacterized protein n=1 Tax=Triparma laevis f. longispina TaxID=1714387 RepID=A0A9W7FJA1_9STRA|nr:hypothetical protein TrLO_g1896 [Triparma laevis f. longispina]
MLFSSFRLLGWCFAFKLGLKLREAAAKLPAKELSEFLCQTLLVGGTTAMGPMFFFSFEAVSCFVKMNYITGNESSSCEMTAISGTFLSLYVSFFTTMSIVSNTSDLETMSRRQRSVRAISSREMQNGMVLGVLL